MQEVEALFVNCETDGILVFKIEVDGSGAVFNPVGYLADGQLLESFPDIDAHGGFEDLPPNFLPLSLFAFLYAHGLNSV
jgi:hypothetical protein